MPPKVQVCISIDRDMYEEYSKISKESGLPVSRLLELKLRGYTIEKQ